MRSSLKFFLGVGISSTTFAGARFNFCIALPSSFFSSCFKSGSSPASFTYCLFLVFTNITIYVKKCPVSGARIRTHNLLYVSFLPLQLDQGFSSYLGHCVYSYGVSLLPLILRILFLNILMYHQIYKSFFQSIYPYIYQSVSI